MEIVLSTKILLNGVEIGSHPKSINFVSGAALDVTVDSDNNFTVTIPGGATTHFVATAPDASVGISGDLAVLTTNNSLYARNGATWVLVINNA